MLVVPYEDKWVPDICAHCQSPILYLDRQPRAEDLRDFIPPIWLEPGLWGELVAFGVLEENWREVFGAKPTLVFKPNKRCRRRAKRARLSGNVEAVEKVLSSAIA